MFYRLIVIFAVLSAASASAQTTVVPPASNRMTIVSEPRDAAVRAQASITFVVPGSADDASPEAEKIREGARRSMYESPPASADYCLPCWPANAGSKT